MQTAANTARYPLQTLVGYSNRTMPGSSFRLYSVPWQGVNGSFDIQTLVGGVTTTAELDVEALAEGDPIDPMVANAPQIQIQKENGGYDTFYYVKNALKSVDFSDEDNPVFERVVGWCDINGALVGTEFCTVDTEGKLTPGAAVWFKDNAVTSDEYTLPITSGAVIDHEVDIETPVGFRLRAPMLPMEFCLSDANLVTYTGLYGETELDVEALAEGDPIEPMTTAAPQIQIQKANGGYDTFYYVKNALKSVDFSDEDNPVFERVVGWCDINGALVGTEYCTVDTEGKVPVNGAFWAKGVTQEFTMTFKPLAK